MTTQAATPLARQLTRAALPLVPSLGFTSAALVAAAASTPLPTPLSHHTLHALFPSPPPAQPSSLSLSGLAMGNGGRRSRSRQELIALARGQGTASRGVERIGPARALVQEWLVQGRQDMARAVRDSGLRGDDALRFGIARRLALNEPVLDKLPQALALLSAPSSTYLSNPLAALSLPSPAGHLSHVAHIAQDLAKASGSEAQGTEWYSLRLRLATIYALSELSLLAPASSSPSPSPASSPSSVSPSAPPADAAERIAAAQQYADRLFEQSGKLSKEVANAALFLEWVRKSWMGIGRSLLA